MYIVECSVNGGVTGPRTGVLKENGNIKYFDTLAEAESRASELMKTMNAGNKSIYTSPRFSYWASPA